MSLPRYWLQDQDNRIRRQEDQATNMVRRSSFLWSTFTFTLEAAEGFRWMEMDDKIAIFQLPSNSSTWDTYILCNGDMDLFHCVPFVSPPQLHVTACVNIEYWTPFLCKWNHCSLLAVMWQLLSCHVPKLILVKKHFLDGAHAVSFQSWSEGQSVAV